MKKPLSFGGPPVSGLKDTLAQVVWAAPSQTTRYLRTAYYKSDSCPYSFDTVKVRVIEKNIPSCTTVSRPDLKEKNRNFEVYPNPTNETFHLRYDTKSEFILILSSITGLEVMRLNLNEKGEKTIDVSKLAEGMYIVSAKGSTGNILFTENLVIIR